MVRGIDNFFFKLRKYVVRRRPSEPPRRRNMTENEIEMRNIAIGDIATTSHDNVENNLIERISEDLSQNNRFYENHMPESNNFHNSDKKKFVSRSVSAFVLGQDKAMKLFNQRFRRSIK